MHVLEVRTYGSSPGWKVLAPSWLMLCTWSPPTPPLARVQLQGCLEPWELNVQDLAKALPGHLGQPWMSEQGGSLFPDGSCSQTKNSQ